MSEKDEAKYVMDKAVKFLGYTELKREQELAIWKFVEGNDVFVNLPTGFGKTLCYTCLPVLFDALQHHLLHPDSAQVIP